MGQNTGCYRGMLHHQENQTVRQRMRRAGRRVMVILWGQISEMMDQVWTRHHQQCQERQHGTQRTETTTVPVRLRPAWKAATSCQETLDPRQSRDA